MKYPFFYALAPLALQSSFALTPVDTAKLQFSIGTISASGYAEIAMASSEEGIGFEHFELSGWTADVRYIYSRYTAIALKGYQYSDCQADNNAFAFDCNIDSHIWGRAIELQTGYNLNGNGPFIYTGVNYWWEGNQYETYGNFSVPFGIGITYNQFSLELATELTKEDGLYYDLSEFEIFSISPSYQVKANNGLTVGATPVTIKMGYRF